MAILLFLYFPSTERFFFFCFHRTQMFSFFSSHCLIAAFFISFPFSFYISISFFLFTICISQYQDDQPRLLHLFFNIFQCIECRARFTDGKYKTLGYLCWVQEFSNDDKKELVSVMQYATSRHNQLAVASGFFCIDDAAFRKFGSQQIRQVMWVSMVASTCSWKDGGIKELVTFPFCDRMVAVTLVNGSRFLQIILDSNRRKSKLRFTNMNTRQSSEL